MLRVNTKPRHRNSPRIAEKSAPGFLQWLRGRDCLAAKGNCEGKIQAAHVDYAGDKGMGTKVRDSATVPLCELHHFVQHSCGWPQFERKLLGGEGKALEAAKVYWHAWPGRIAWERKLEEANG